MPKMIVLKAIFLIKREEEKKFYRAVVKRI